VELRAEEVKVEILHPSHAFEPVATHLEIRWDPLTGQTSRVLPPSGLLPRQRFDLSALAAETRADCPFCAERIDSAVPRFPPGILPQGRVKVGEAMLFPNLLPYSQYSSVSVYSPGRHFLTLSQLTPRLVTDNLATQVAFARAVLAADPGAAWASVNANHMLPSGSSIFHPHFQGAVHPTPTNQQRLLTAVSGERYTDYLATEHRLGRRWLGELGGIFWLAGFAPLGPGDIRAFIPGVASPAELTPQRVEALGTGISLALGLYAELGFESFNMALYGAPPRTRGYVLNLRLVCRSNLEPFYRSEVAWLDRVHSEPAVDLAPEDLADRAADRFRR
jgi:UDPglucose--hexose-1-phosphate uridylyltransferase